MYIFGCDCFVVSAGTADNQISSPRSTFVPGADVYSTALYMVKYFLLATEYVYLYISNSY